MHITEGESCSAFLAALLKTKVDGMTVSQMLTSSSSCSASAKIHGTKQQNALSSASDSYILPFHLAFNRTAASCMGAPAMGYDPDIPIFNEGKMDGWNRARAPSFGTTLTPINVPRCRTVKEGDLSFCWLLASSFDCNQLMH